MAPPDAMQFGRALQRIPQETHHANPVHGPVHLSKINIADGFCRVWVRDQDLAKLAILFPSCAGEEPLIGTPLVLPMGWKESPPSFCAVTETVADLANAKLSDPTHQPEQHRLEEVSETPPTEPPPIAIADPRPSEAPPQQQPHLRHKCRQPVSTWDVCVDDFIRLAQGNKWRRRRVKWILLHALDSALRGLNSNDTASGQEPAFVKKLKKGDACWATTKAALGWLIDAMRKTMELPTHRQQRLDEIPLSVRPTQKRISTCQWHKLVGELRSVLIALILQRVFL